MTGITQSLIPPAAAERSESISSQSISITDSAADVFATTALNGRQGCYILNGGSETIYLGDDSDQLFELSTTAEPLWIPLSYKTSLYAKCAATKTSTLLILEV